MTENNLNKLDANVHFSYSDHVQEILNDYSFKDNPDEYNFLQSARNYFSYKGMNTLGNINDIEDYMTPETEDHIYNAVQYLRKD